MSLLRKALEGDQETPPTTIAEPATPALNEGNQPNNTESAVIMTGPLGQVYTQALAIAFAKQSADHTAAASEGTQTVTEVQEGAAAPAMESQANDAIIAAGAITAVTGSEAEVIDNPEALIYGVSAQHIDEKTVTDVATQMSQFELDKPEEFIVVVDATDMAQQADAGVDQTQNAQNANEYLTQPVNDANLEKAELLPVLESMVVRMGGRVVYSLSAAMECIAEMRAETAEEATGEVIGTDTQEDPTNTGVTEVAAIGDGGIKPLPTPEPIAEAGTDSVSAPEGELATESDDDIYEKLKALREEIEYTSPENINKTSILKSIVSMISMESEKGGKKGIKPKAGKAEKTSAKLTRAVGMINGVMGDIKETKVRAELHHAVGVILSAKRDVVESKGKKVALEGQKSGWDVFFEVLNNVLDNARIEGIVTGLKRTKSNLETMEGKARRDQLTDTEVISTCNAGAVAVKNGLTLIDEQMSELKKLKQKANSLFKQK